MNSWEVTTIGEIGQVFDGPHATPKTIDKGPIFLGIPSLNAGRLDLSNTRHVSEEDFVKWTKRVEPKAGDIVFSYETKIGEAAVIPKGLRCCLGRRMGLVRLNPEICDSRFFLYQYLSPNYQKFLASMTVHGATVDRLLLKDFPSFNFPLPPIDEQREIASILGALDDKIELNRRMSATLEDMARSLYRSWFVDFDPVHAKMEGRQPAFMDEATAALFPDRFGEDGLPEGWDMSVLSKMAAKVRNGGTPRKSSHEFWENGTVPWLTSGEVRQSMIIRTTSTITEKGLQSSSAKWVEKGATVVALYGATAGQVSRTAIPLTTNQAICSISAHTGFEDFLYFSLKEQVESLADQAVGSAQQNISKKIVEELAVLRPRKQVVCAFQSRSSALFSRIEKCWFECQTLAALRDSLLPKLMSGELRVGEAREQVEEVA